MFITSSRELYTGVLFIAALAPHVYWYPPPPPKSTSFMVSWALSAHYFSPCALSTRARGPTSTPYFSPRCDIHSLLVARA